MAMSDAIAAGEGEHLIHFRDGSDIYIKFADAGSLAIGTQQVKRGTGIPVHRHRRMHEYFYVVSGGGAVSLNEQPHTISQGSAVSIAPDTWHAFENPDQELLLLWMVTPPGLENFFRETCDHPAEAKKRLTREQIRAIALKYDVEFR